MYFTNKEKKNDAFIVQINWVGMFVQFKLSFDNCGKV